ncbi:hypothetical protein AGMMS50212_03350 [Spirochaetia bacterium]|nr:hypothetical protein AGMMS50212_03350 [Spirochaetia bacterium]
MDDGTKIEIRIEKSAASGEFSIVLARELSGSYPGWAKGSFIFTRAISGGAPLRIRIFLLNDPYTYIQFRPNGNEKSFMDVVIYNAYMAQSVSVPLPINRILTAPLDEVLTIADREYPLKYFEIEPDNYLDTRSLIEKIRKNIKGLEFADDGAIDENGNYVFINDLSAQKDNVGLNCSGFSKWLVDGILHPITGTRLEINKLKQPFGERGSSLTAPYEPIRDPFFGLDWIRNLASAVGTAFKSPVFGELEEIEVRQSPFASVIIRGARTSQVKLYPGFLPNAGYGFEGLQALLWTLAIDEPGYIYLGAVNNELRPKPRMRQYFHIAALIPYFDEQSVFHIAVFESAVETQFSRFRNRYPDHYINLVRLPIESAFEP